MSRNKLPVAIANATSDDMHDAYVNDGNLKASEEELDEIREHQTKFINDFMVARGDKSKQLLIDTYRKKYGITPIDRADTDTPSTPARTVACRHEFVNIGFTTRRMICKHCDLEE